MGELTEIDSLDYHITFPSVSYSSLPYTINKGDTLSTSSIIHDHSHDEFVFIYENDKIPVIVLLGWAGCQDKYLSKYSAIYEEKNCITLRYIAPIECLFWKRDKLPNIAKQLLDVILDNDLDKHPIFFHLFSNGGTAVYQHISFTMEHENYQLQVKGVIFDSAPGQRRITSLYKAVSAIIGGNLLKNIALSCVITAFIGVLWISKSISKAWNQSHKPPEDVFLLTEESRSWPQLFLYSNTDTLIPATDVEMFANRRAERGVNVQLVLFTDSPHVKLYTMHPNAYVNTVCNFIHKCLTNETDDNTKIKTTLASMPIVKEIYYLSTSNNIENSRQFN